MNVQVRRGSIIERAYQLAINLTEMVHGSEASAATDLHYRGGKTIPNLVYKNFYVGGVASWSTKDIKSIDATLAAAMTDPALNAIMQQYFASPITTSCEGSDVLPGAKPRVVTQASIEATIRRLYHEGAFKAFDLERTVFNFLLPSGTILTDDDSPRAEQPHQVHAEIPFEDEASSLAGLGGYHGSVHVTGTVGRRTIYYAIGVYSEIRDGTENGIPVFTDSWKNVVATSYHELCEARTDPDVEDVLRGILPGSGLGWVSDQGLECGDFPVFEVGGDRRRVFVELDARGTTVPVQLQYSNKVHGPERP